MPLQEQDVSGAAEFRCAARCLMPWVSDEKVEGDDQDEQNGGKSTASCPPLFGRYTAGSGRQVAGAFEHDQTQQ